MTATTELPLSVRGHPLEMDPSALGSLRPTAPNTPATELREAMDGDGYVYLPGFFERDDVMSVRRELITRLDVRGFFEPDTDPMDGFLRPEPAEPLHDPFRTLSVGNEPMHRLLYQGRMMSLWRDFLGGEVRHFDYTWVRSTRPGKGTAAHTDIVFMGRGTKQLYTAWVPYGDISRELGGLAVLENGHRHSYIRDEYATQDADAFCENLGEEPTPGPNPEASYLDRDVAALRQRLGGRWLTTDYAAGDLVIFGMFTPHAGLDNHSGDRIRLSSDSRYQLASEDVDPRWIGEDPIAHGPNAKLGLIC